MHWVTVKGKHQLLFMSTQRGIVMAIEYALLSSICVSKHWRVHNCAGVTLVQAQIHVHLAPTTTSLHMIND